MSKSALRFLDPDDRAAREEWDDAVKRFPGGTVFHTTAWMDVVRYGVGLAPRFAYLEGRNGSVRALVPLFRGGWAQPKRWMNLPQGCPSDPLAADEPELVLLLEQLASCAAECRAKVVVRTPRRLAFEVPEGWEARCEQPVIHHVLALTGASDVESLPQLQTGQRRILRRVGRRFEARGNKLSVITRNEVDAFARAVHHIYLRRHGQVGARKKFFEALIEFLPDAARLLLVETSAGPPSAFSVLILKPPHAHLLYGSGLPTSEGTEAYRYCVAMQIQASIQAGAQEFDFGESGPHQDGLIYFKETWGAEKVDGSYLVIAPHGAASGLRVPGHSFALAQRFLHAMPVGVSLMVAGPIHKALQ